MARHRVLTPLRWSDMDAYGHVNNVQFLRLLEDARVSAFAGHGSDEGGGLISTGLIVARTEIEYLRQLVYRPAPVAIDLWVTDIGAASFDLSYEVLDDAATLGVDPGGADTPAASRPVLYARAATKLVPFDMQKERPVRINDDHRQVLQAWQDSPLRWRHRARP